MNQNWGILDAVLRAYRNDAFEYIARMLEKQYGARWFEDQVHPLFSAEEWKILD